VIEPVGNDLPGTTAAGRNLVDRMSTALFSDKVNALARRCKGKAADPRINFVGQRASLAGFAIVQHEAPPIAFKSLLRLGAIGDVAAIGGVLRRKIVCRVVLGQSMGLTSRNRHGENIAIRRERLKLVCIAHKCQLFGIWRESIVVGPAQAKWWRVI